MGTLKIRPIDKPHIKRRFAKMKRELGMSYAQAQSILRKSIFLDLIKKLGQDQCFHCGKKIEDAKYISIEHKNPWLLSSGPKETFFDIKNIAFSHRACNSRAGALSTPRRQIVKMNGDGSVLGVFTATELAQQYKIKDRSYLYKVAKSRGRNGNLYKGFYWRFL
jgi:hypothetical protein|tara:strand:+ start:4564 stop:5055 length:492 start_codon:yes stop_codon:yes gene_type:complete